MVRTGKRGVRKEDLSFFDKLRTRFTIALLGAVLVITSFVLYTLVQDYRDIINESAKNSMDRLSKAIFQTLYTSMNSGANSEQVREALERAQGEHYVKTLELYVGQQIYNRFRRSETIPNYPAKVEEIFKSGKEHFSLIESEFDREIHYLKPFKAEENCLACHYNAKTGDVLGVMDLSFSLIEYDKRSESLIKRIALIIAVLVLGSGAILFYVSTKMIFAPIKDLENATNRLSKNAGDPNVRLGEWGKNEFGVIADHFNRFIEAVYEINRKLEQEEEKVRGLLENREAEIERRTAQVHELNRELNHYFEVVDENVITSRTDINGVITDASAALCRISGYTKEELVGKMHNIMRHPDTPSELFADMWATITHGRIWTGEFKNRTKNGGFYWVQTAISPLFSETSAIKGYIAIRHDISLQKELADTLQKLNEATRQSQTDMLTGIMNRLKINELLNMEIDRAERYDQDLSVALLDIDHFKAVNDTYGHLVGDQTLKTLAQILTTRTRKTDFAARWGGEEFLLVLTNTQEEWAMRKMNQLREIVETHDFGSAPKITISIGVASYHAGDTLESLVGRADVALYLAKEGGRNRVEVATNETDNTNLNDKNDKKRGKRE
ncbi:MAG: diguanylate cyclase [Helicobacteraceae bacterium]|jgi:diguanylate cyclase (GGDEF)-like protein/PAS domain S-box-containing protein|nr:diguanylate cyclase [Helicobacteraceae bacterium]